MDSNSNKARRIEVKRICLFAIAFVLVFCMFGCKSEEQKEKETLDELIVSMEENENKKEVFKLFRSFDGNDNAQTYIINNVSEETFEFTYKNGALISGVEHILDLMKRVGWSNFPISKIEQITMQYIDSYYKAVEKKEKFSTEYGNDTDFPGELKSLFEISKEDKERELEKRIETSALSALRSQLKDPKSLEVLSCRVSARIDDDGKYTANVLISYTATNSFGGRIKDSFIKEYSGTYE